MRKGLGLLLLLALVAHARPRPDFGIVFNDDADLAFLVPDRARSEALLRANVAALADTPVKTLAYCVGMGGDVLYYNTKVASRVGWRHAPDETPGSLMAKRMENARTCLAQGADAVRTAGEAAKRCGLLFIPSLRLNDAHFMEKPDEHSMTSEFWFRHREEFTIKRSPLAFQPAYGNLLDFMHPEVRQLRLDTVMEVLERNRDLVDGFELDFNRFQVFFPKGEQTAGAPLMTELVRRVRARLDQLSGELARPLYLLVRVPPSLADSTAAGLEVARWMREGLVDLVSPAQLMTLAGDMPVADFVALGRETGVKVHPSLYPRTSWRIPFPPAAADRYAGAPLGRMASAEEIRAAAAGYWAAGVDGFYLFNFYNAFGALRPHEDQFYAILRDLARPENLAGQSKVYVVTKSYYNDGPGSYAYGKQLPAKLSPGAPRPLTLRTDAITAGLFALQTCELRVGLRGLSTRATVRITLNGHPVFDGRPTSTNSFAARQAAGTASRPRDAAELYLHVPLAAPGLVVAGENALELAVAGDAAEVTDLELRCDYHHDLEQLWRRDPALLNGRPQ